MILDSTFLIDLLRDSRVVDELVTDLDASGTPFVSVVSVMELVEGIHLADATDDERVAIHSLLEDLSELPFDRACAVKAGELNARLVTAGEPIDESDVMIAATALVHDRPLVTRNVPHFDRIEDLSLVTY